MKFISALKKKKVERDFYVALILKPHKATAILFEKTEDNLSILATKEDKLEKDIDSLSAEELVSVSDSIVSGVEVSLPEQTNLEKTIFSVPYSWQQDGKITRPNLEKLKAVCDQLELKAIGFIISIEAVVSFMQQKDGAPITAIFVEHFDKQVFVYMVRNGQIVEAQSSDAGENVVQSVEKLLDAVTQFDVLPSKMYLNDYENAEKVQQKFLSHDWKDKLNFLHDPQVVILEKDLENQAVINGVASQMGFDGLMDVSLSDNETKDSGDDSEEISAEVAATATAAELAAAEEFGFVQNEDVRAQGAEPVDEVEAIQEAEDRKQTDEDKDKKADNDELETIADESLGDHSFHEDSNISEPKISRSGYVSDKDNDNNDIVATDKAFMDEDDGNENDSRVTLVDKLKSAAPIGIVRAILSGKGSSALKKSISPRLIVILVVVVAAIIGIAYIYFTFFLKAEVVVFADSKVLSKEESVTFSSDEHTSYSDKVIALHTVDESVNGSASKDVTGTKETGTKATGEVVVYNKTEKPVTFDKGTTISSSNGLDFVTLDDVKIASTSSFSTSFSSAKVKVESSKFGKEYNLPSGTNFTVDGESNSDYIAKNESAFSGGTKKELEVVSQKDLDQLEEKIENGTADKALNAATGKLGADTLLIKTPLGVKLDNEKYSKKAGEEAKTVTLTADIVYTFGTYAKNDLVEFVKQMAKDEVPDEYVYVSEQSEVRVDNVKVDDGDVTGTLKTNSVFAPSVQTSTLMTELKGKPLGKAESMIKGMKGVSDYKIIRRNVIPLFPSFMPFNTKNIEVTVRTNG